MPALPARARIRIQHSRCPSFRCLGAAAYVRSVQRTLLSEGEKDERDTDRAENRLCGLFRGRASGCVIGFSSGWRSRACGVRCLLRQSHKSGSRAISRRPESLKVLWSRASDVTLFGVSGGSGEHGRDKVGPRLDWTHTQYSDGIRATWIFRRELDDWHIIHRHADSMMRRQGPAEAKK